MNKTYAVIHRNDFSARQRAIMQSLYDKGKSPGEIAKVFKCQPSDVKRELDLR